MTKEEKQAAQPVDEVMEKKINETETSVKEEKGETSMSGQLIIEDTLVGTGATVKTGDMIKIHYGFRLN